MHGGPLQTEGYLFYVEGSVEHYNRVCDVEICLPPSFNELLDSSKRTLWIDIFGGRRKSPFDSKRPSKVCSIILIH
jgi:hypothetical protein